MIRVTIEQKRGPVTRRVAVTAPSIARALELAGAGRDGIEAKVLFPIDPDTYFVPEGSGESAAPEGAEELAAIAQADASVASAA